MNEAVILLTLCSATILTSIISATIGIAGGILLLSLMTFFYPMSVIIPIHGVVQLLSNGSRVLFLKEKISKPLFWTTSLGIPFGTVIAVLGLKHLSGEKAIILGVVTLIIYSVFKPKKMPSLKLPLWGYFFLGMTIGILGPFIGATGPLLGPFMIRDDLSKEEIISTQASIQVIGHIMKIPAFLAVGFNFLNYWPTIIFMSLCALIGTKWGVYLLRRLPEKPFRILFKAAMLVSAVRLIMKFLLN
ncbi:MAG: hypothetical protein COW00_15885 [Bdellovibrio sp. CG12_big_fil_rev_8_21_14_0_65_39_13]|nr:MAG: hypothetical protein COW78_02260 [Bdellovibrio sp. CG22_combo_CG10-13_8_21_14_all_39_27]PIQ58326.1 MAG: hypothetical protein COW00_15885 [Bdellovibrio sp. CG12_big_fil_rev_8_21_14_0_65_39_13]PIR35838.1 MAG: hypothetical protein COV37_06465 [Bdellovibrio sp. CG11_big_fil_rev_8_21_14_0_20_39_38]